MKVNIVGDIGVFKKFEELDIDPFKDVSLPESDFNIGNLEFVVSKFPEKAYYDVQEKYSCSFDYFQKLTINKFNGLGLANNHCLDYGLKGVLNTTDYLRLKDIEVFGFSEHDGYTLGEFVKDDIKIAIIACVKPGRWSKENYGFGPDSYNIDKICELIKKINKKYNHIIIFPHWGSELIEVPNYKDTINAKRLIDIGASAVIGHHPHIPQGIEMYNGGLIAYSLGSFIYISEEEMGYSADNTNRDFSICLNIELNEKRIVNYTSYFYRFSKKSMIPERITTTESDNYSNYLNKNIYNQRLFKEQYRVLVKRELRSFFQRLRHNPTKTLINYIKLLKFKYVFKLFSIKYLLSSLISFKIEL